MESKIESMDPSWMETYTIPAGTLLYHGTVTKEYFNPNNIILNDSNLVSFFSPNKRFAADYMSSCSKYPAQDGYIHMFEVKEDIPNIFIVSPYEITDKWDEEYVYNNYCSLGSNVHGTVFNGVGFFISSIENDPTVPTVEPTKEQSNEIAEFAICNPGQYLTYINTERCVARRRLSGQYRFD
jgi:hypothetical protein